MQVSEFFPAALPPPQHSTRTARPISPIETVAVSGGLPAKRNRFSRAGILRDLEWLFSDEEAVLFDDWFANNLNNGTKFFLMVLPDAYGGAPKVFRFADAIDRIELVGALENAKWRYAATLEQYGLDGARGDYLPYDLKLRGKINFLDSIPISPSDGDIWFANNKFWMHTDGETKELGGGPPQQTFFPTTETEFQEALAADFAVKAIYPAHGVYLNDTNATLTVNGINYIYLSLPTIFTPKKVETDSSGFIFIESKDGLGNIIGYDGHTCDLGGVRVYVTSCYASGRFTNGVIIYESMPVTDQTPIDPSWTEYIQENWRELLPKVTTEDSDTVTFSGLGTPQSPLKAETKELGGGGGGSVTIDNVTFGDSVNVTWEGAGSAEEPFTATITAPQTGWIFDEGEV